MEMPVWACDDTECIWLLCAETRAKANVFCQNEYYEGTSLSPHFWQKVSIRRVKSDGSFGRGGRQAVVESVSPRQLEEDEFNRLGWKMCVVCQECWAVRGKDRCDFCLMNDEM